ncbi:MAG: hypothetical protein NDI60_07070 [Elusimicrobiales bacterium]|nr:hypothetical protein [Elusimicrobiales bacterium]
MPTRSFFLLSLLLGLAPGLFAAPNQPVISMPVNATTGYNTRPWVRFSATDGSGHNINRVLVYIDNTAGQCTRGNILQQNSATHASTFYPLPAASGATITHRLVTGLAAGTYYMCVLVYCDQAIGSAWSAERQFTVATPVWTDSPTVTTSTKIRVSHFTELRTTINNVRAFYGVAAYSWTDASLTTAVKVRAVHMTDLRTALCGAYAAATGSACSLTFTDSITTAIKIRTVHVNELRTKLVLP